MTTETIFLISLFGALGFLLAALGIARWNWRKDIEPFNRGTDSIDVLIHPDRYMQTKQLRLVRILSIIGGMFLVSAVILLGTGLVGAMQ
jgi:hypothetical protein